MELRGRLMSDFGSLCPCWIRGRISRLWMTTARRDRPADPRDPATWEPAWGSRTLIPMTEQLLVGAGQQLPELPAGATESGWLAELDLDDVPDGRTGGVRGP